MNRSLVYNLAELRVRAVSCLKMACLLACLLTRVWRICAGMVGIMGYLFSASNVSCTLPQGDGERVIFSDVSLDVAPGEIVDLTGPSGAGKSSLLTAFAKLNPNARGEFALQGRDSREFTVQQWRAQVAYLPQKPILMGQTVAQTIRLPWTLAIRNTARETPTLTTRLRSFFAPAHASADILPDQRIRRTLDALGCEDIDLDRAPHDLSGGQAARVSLARTLLTEPKVLLADEVDAGLDDVNADKVAAIMANAAAGGMAVIRVRHRPPDGRASRVLTLQDGRLTAASAREGDAA